jgi:Dna[CI] antecedent, DciA
MRMEPGEKDRNAPQHRDNSVGMRRRFPTRVDTVVENVLTRRKMSARVAETRIFQAFMDIAGAATRKHARPIKMKGGEMTVAVDSASWRQQLQLMAEDLKRKTNKKLGRDLITGLRFTHGLQGGDAFAPLEEPPPPSPLRDASPMDLAEADTLSRLVHDPELAASIAHAYLGAKRSGRT